MTSMWSEMNPTGASTTAVLPPAAISASASLTSGSSHGTRGGPDREQYTSRHGNSRPSTAAAPSATSRATSSCCRAYDAGRATPDDASIAFGIEWVTNTRSASAASPVTSNSPNAATTASTFARTNPGVLKSVSYTHL